MLRRKNSGKFSESNESVENEIEIGIKMSTRSEILTLSRDSKIKTRHLSLRKSPIYKNSIEIRHEGIGSTEDHVRETPSHYIIIYIIYISATM